eukprot:12086188-Alexandrium_andersonii.AAC.1
MRGADVIPREIRWKLAESEGDEGGQRAQQEHAGHAGRRIKPEGPGATHHLPPRRGGAHAARQGPTRAHIAHEGVG